MNQYFTDTLVNITVKKVSQPPHCDDEKEFLADLFNEELIEVGHIQLIPAQDRICITATISREEDKIYNIKQPQLEFLTFLFKNTSRDAKKAIRYYFLNSSDAQQQLKNDED